MLLIVSNYANTALILVAELNVAFFWYQILNFSLAVPLILYVLLVYSDHDLLLLHIYCRIRIAYLANSLSLGILYRRSRIF
jgi:hypothetical protein